MSTPSSRPTLRFGEFVAIIAGLMAINALGIDTMLPALPQMAHALHIGVENDRQYIIAAYVFGFGAAQIIYGPLVDRFGRKPVLIVSLSLFVATSLAATFAVDLQTIVVARLMQGVAAAASRVLATSIVRDRFSGRTMARVMSLAFIVFLSVPIIAPSFGQLILLVGPWRWIFYFLAIFGAVLGTWAGTRLPETLDPANRRPIRGGVVIAGFREVLGNRFSLGYALASACIYGALMGFINSVEQIFAEVFHRPEIFTLVFAVSASSMALASWLNSAVIERLGTRLISHAALLGFIAVTGVHLALASAGFETVVTFTIFQAATLFCFALAGSNFGAMAMEPVGHIAGTAAAVQGAIASVGGALLGLATSQRFNGTVLPTLEGYVALGVLALIAVFVTEQGRLFRPHIAGPAAA